MNQVVIKSYIYLALYIDVLEHVFNSFLHIV